MALPVNQGNSQFFNNADSFAMAFDDHWKISLSDVQTKDITKEQRIEIIFEEIKDHPFLKENRNKAKEIADFRLRLLNLS